MSISYSDSLTNIDSFEMTVNNWDAETQAFKYSDSSMFLPWRDVEVKMGYYRNGLDERRKMLTGEITTMTPNFPQSGSPTLTVRGLNLLHRFRIKQDTHIFLNKMDTEIAEYLVGKIDEAIRTKVPGLKVKLDEKQAALNKQREKGKEVPSLVMQNQYPIVFLVERPTRIGYDISIKEVQGENEREAIFGFGPTNDVGRPTYVLEWGKSLISFQPNFRTAEQVYKITVRGWDPKSKQPIEEFATRDDLKGEGVIDPKQLGVIEPALAQEITVDRPVSNKAEAKEYAKAMLRQKATELITAKGKTIGAPDLRAGVRVQILKLGRFSQGSYLVTETTHTIGDGGYTTDFSARMGGGIG